ncbi:unnamed protein product [Linum trigynum]|uniref:TF-B3 domain-containing protein n=1 Tax=Linum trigynum TaxID=586398 RepID=A0AAV2D2I7_9ROSI
MYLPLEFADKYFPEDRVMVKLRACCEEVEGFLNETQVVAERDNHNTLYLRRRWGEFRTNNDLHEGDVSLLQLVDVKDKIFNVYVFRA